VTRTDALIAAVTYEISRHRAAIDAAVNMNSVMILCRTTAAGQPKKTTVSVQTESDAPTLAALAALIPSA